MQTFIFFKYSLYDLGSYRIDDDDNDDDDNNNNNENNNRGKTLTITTNNVYLCMTNFLATCFGRNGQ